MLYVKNTRGSCEWSSMCIEFSYFQIYNYAESIQSLTKQPLDSMIKIVYKYGHSIKRLYNSLLDSMKIQSPDKIYSLLLSSNLTICNSTQDIAKYFKLTCNRLFRPLMSLFRCTINVRVQPNIIEFIIIEVPVGFRVLYQSVPILKCYKSLTSIQNSLR